ncbi:hypothetical protein [Bacillus toyonensis]|uniref:hypothetical protein n=1 Tax=Bacillus toyonensis TaxID=155322 RepID=UPI0020D27243|nr:hypothetical protein [Bacillus toyonensis]
MKLKSEVNFNNFYFGKIEWNEMFDSEEELIGLVKKINMDRYKQMYCKGWLYVEGFQRTLSSGKELSPKQVTQLKRIAREIYKYYNKM